MKRPTTQNSIIAAKLAANQSEYNKCLSSNDQLISVFLKFADLQKFEALFQRFGVYKFDHLSDVQAEDLHKFGNYLYVDH